VFTVWCRRRTEESDTLTAVKKSVVVCKSDNHDGTDDNLAVDNDGLLLDGVHAKDSSLGKVEAARQL
jgi:hypothetical protein